LGKRAGRVPNTRELVFAGRRYILPYGVRPESVEILRVLHGAPQIARELSSIYVVHPTSIEFSRLWSFVGIPEKEIRMMVAENAAQLYGVK
jgi:hypothetical protein